MAIMTHAKFHFNRLMFILIFGIRASEPPRAWRTTEKAGPDRVNVVSAEDRATNENKLRGKSRHNLHVIRKEGLNHISDFKVNREIKNSASLSSLSEMSRWDPTAHDRRHRAPGRKVGGSHRRSYYILKVRIQSSNYFLEVKISKK